MTWEEYEIFKEETDYKMFGLRVLYARLSRNMTATKLAELVGIDRSWLWQIEKGGLRCHLGKAKVEKFYEIFPHLQKPPNRRQFSKLDAELWGTIRRLFPEEFKKKEAA